MHSFFHAFLNAFLITFLKAFLRRPSGKTFLPRTAPLSGTAGMQKAQPVFPAVLQAVRLTAHQECFIASATQFWCISSTFLLPWVLLP